MPNYPMRVKDLCLRKLSVECLLDFIPLKLVTREDLKGGWIYCRELGFSFVRFAIHEEVAFWVYVYINADDYADAFCLPRCGFSTIEEYLEDVKDNEAHATIQDDLLRGFPVAVKTTDIMGLNPFCGDRSLLSKFELEILEQYMPLMTLDELF